MIFIILKIYFIQQDYALIYFMVNYEENIYNRITTYYDISEKIKVEILKLEDISDSEKFDYITFLESWILLVMKFI